MVKQNHGATADAILSEQFINGRRVGLQGLSSSSVQGRPGTPEHEEGLRGWRSAQSDLSYQDAMWSMA